MNAKTHRYSLDSSSKKHKCPQCEKKRFVRYKDQTTKEYLPDDVGRCDREQSCGYHYTPKQHYEANKHLIDAPTLPKSQRPKYRNRIPKAAPKISLLPFDMVSQTVRRFEANYFTQYLYSLFCDELAESLIKRFYIGTSKRWRGANVFWQIDSKGNARQAKVMLYHPNTGRRVKEDEKPNVGWAKIYFAGKAIFKNLTNAEPNLQQCFFGEHQLQNASKELPIAIVESEKTAVLMSVILPDCIWLATGGKNGCRWTSYEVGKVLIGRKVILYPDLGCFEDWQQKGKELSRYGCHVSVSDLLERNATPNDKNRGLDLADFYIRQDSKFGWALKDNAYPLFWDY